MDYKISRVVDDDAKQKHDDAFRKRLKTYFDRRETEDIAAQKAEDEIRPGLTRSGREWRDREL